MTEEQKEIKKQVQETCRELMKMHREAIEKYKAGETTAASVDQLTKLVSCGKSLREYVYSTWDIHTKKEEQTMQLEKEKFELEKKTKTAEAPGLPPFFARIEEQLLELDEEEEEKLHQKVIVDTVQENMFRQY